MAFKDWMNNLRDYFVEDDEEFNEPTRPVQESRPTVASTPKPKVEEWKVQADYQSRRPAQSTPKPQAQTAAPKRSASTFSKPMPEKIVQQQTVSQAQSLAATVSTIAIKEPRAYADIMESARIVKNGECVLVNFKFMSDAQARRSIDFMTGVVFTLDGDIQNVGGQIFLMTPANITVDAAKEMSILAGQNFESYDNY
ncbi:cell division protein SepF [Lactococcus cremoris]|uniref:cell division protein SepF n=1 Tax=Lactococcus lactis subsp. cremoris TaxID=1359 RepID=UPI00218219A2|nr:cell division protein SepF [Lactococcus cremoris]MCT0467665.1 cell division protein SepF [Lactococcus cremoris]